METAAKNQIVLTALNSRYMHTAFGLRYLYANLGELQSSACIEEFTIQQRAIDIAEKLLKHEPKVIGFGVYIWNVSEVTKTVKLLKQISPETIIVLGGPEVSQLPDKPAVVDIADYVVMGAAEKSFRELCQLILSGNKPLAREIQSDELALDKIQLPYKYYTDDDIKNRLIYVEASRGCPFKCEFCLSSLDKTSKPFELGLFLDEMDMLYRRGARNFKFIDRTFNLKVSSSIAILEFFLQRMTDDLYLHFEVVPDNLPDKLKAVIQKFPYHSLQFEVGVQTFDEGIQALISRKQNNIKSCENLRWLRQETHAYIHADLIFGLPSDTLTNFAKSFDKLVDLNPHEVQLGILKRLRGVPLNRHNEEYQLRYNP
ncbi:MAG: B12-binding domain-containing radical SAM protein, partial [Gammaproteobacteria bacterium]|nr:B12-binding domain-containing radical SAM protein [Gammaproteobacteria bacterium]